MTIDDNTRQNSLAIAAKLGDENAFASLISLNDHFVRYLVRSYWASGAERDDVRQEAHMGLVKAVDDYNPSVGPFAPFARLCMRRNVYTFAKKMNSTRNYALNKAISLNAPVSDENPEPLIARLDSGARTELDALSDYSAILSHLWDICSPIERAVLPLYFAGCTFEEIGQAIAKHRKPVDNAVWRIKLKGRKVAAQIEGGLPSRKLKDRASITA